MEVDVLIEIKKKFKIKPIASVSIVKGWDIPRNIVLNPLNAFIVNKLAIMVGIVNPLEPSGREEPV